MAVTPKQPNLVTYSVFRSFDSDLVPATGFYSEEWICVRNDFKKRENTHDKPEKVDFEKYLNYMIICVNVQPHVFVLNSTTVWALLHFLDPSELCKRQ